MQVVMGLALVCGAIAMYLMASARWGRPAAVIAATAYTYAPYHLVTAYVKGAAAELVSFVWMPLIILALFRLETRPTTTRAMALAVAYAALILTNNSSALLFSLVVVAYVAWASARTRSIAFVAHAAAGLLAGVLLSAFFWLPAIVERSSVQISQMTAGYFDFDRHFVSLGELFYSPWNYGGSGFGNQFTRMAGVMQWGLVAAALVGLRRPQGRPERVFWLVVFAISTAMMLSVSAPVWAATPLLKFLQFPWKFLAATTFAGSCLCGALLAGATSERTRWAVASASVALILAIDLPHARPERVLAASAADVTTPAAVQAITIADMNHRDFTHYYTCYLPVQVCRVPHAVAGSKLEASADVHVLGEDLRTDRYAWHLTADRPVRVVVNTFWFPGWRATIDGRVVDITPETDVGRITLLVPSGEHDVTVRFGDTPLRWWSLVLSAAAALACAAAWIWRR